MPMLLYDYLPGQEEANLDFVRERAMGDYEEVHISRRTLFCVYYIYICASPSLSQIFLCLVRRRGIGDYEEAYTHDEEKNEFLFLGIQAATISWQPP